MCCMPLRPPAPKNIIFRPKTEKNAIFRPETRPPPQMAIFFAPKRPILAQKQCFLGLGGQFKAPPRYFAGARLKKTCVVGYGSRKMGDSPPPPPPKNGHFLPKKGLKMPILGQKQCFLGLGGQFKAPPPYFAGARLKKKTCVAGYGSRKMCESGPPPPKNGQFLPKKRPKNANFGTRTVFFGLGWSVQGPRTLFRRFSTQKNICCRVREPENGFRAAPPPPKWPFFAQKKA